MATMRATCGPCQDIGRRPVNPLALVRRLTYVLTADEAAADHQTVIGPKDDDLDREDSPVMQSAMRLGVNGCLRHPYSTRMRIIRNILASAQPENCGGR